MHMPSQQPHRARSWMWSSSGVVKPARPRTRLPTTCRHTPRGSGFRCCSTPRSAGSRTTARPSTSRPGRGRCALGRSSSRRDRSSGPLSRKDLFWWLTKTRLLTRPASSPIARLLRRKGGELVIGTSPASMRAAGVTMHGRLTGAAGHTVQLADGATLEVDAVVWATGFRSDYSWIDIDGVWDGREAVHQRGRTETLVSGSWVCRGSTPGALPCSASSRTTPLGSPTSSRLTFR
jgi:hypothetical protein